LFFIIHVGTTIGTNEHIKRQAWIMLGLDLTCFDLLFLFVASNDQNDPCFFFFDLCFDLTGTISENIAMGKTTSEATQAEIENAAKAANAHDFIMKIGGYDVDVGPGGSKLSGTFVFYTFI
jgi:hypothetical protein